jgi:pimeloyl-ACP methyl ester carboxylesterase
LTVAFQEAFVEADGFRIRYMVGGEGTPLVHLHGAGGLRLTRAHELLSKCHRVYVFEMPGFGSSAENTRSRSVIDLAATMATALAQLGIKSCDAMGTSFGARVVLWMAIHHPALVRAIVLEGPGAIRPDGHQPPAGTPQEIAQLIFAHPERAPSSSPLAPSIREQQIALVRRLRGPDRDPELEARMRDVAAPVLVVFGTLDRVMPPQMGRYYKMLLPNCHLVFTYDAGHEVSTDRPEAFADVVDDFFQRREAFVISRRNTLIDP